VLHWAHLVWPSVPHVPTLTSLFVILGILGVTIATSLWANKRDAAAADEEQEAVGTP
jgi:tellurite resistance protein TerC